MDHGRDTDAGVVDQGAVAAFHASVKADGSEVDLHPAQYGHGC